MVILLSYRAEISTDGASVRIFSDEPLLCPTCGKSVLIYRDCVRRFFRRAGGDGIWVRIPRARCAVCRELHRLLPVFLCPFKHYLADVIADILENRIPAADLSLLDHPCETTIARWREWAGAGLAGLAENPLYACFSKNARTSAAQSFAAFFSNTG